MRDHPDTHDATSTRRPRTALIIGAGIAGPVLAVALQKTGIEAVIYEAYRGDAEGVGPSSVSG